MISSLEERTTATAETDRPIESDPLVTIPISQTSSLLG